jgi:hypothetical protein
MDAVESSPLIHRLEKLQAAVQRRWQRQIDQTVPFVAARWAASGVALLLFIVRIVWMVQGFYIVTYALGIYMLSLAIGFLSPLDDPDADSTADLPITTSKNDDEFKPFVCATLKPLVNGQERQLTFPCLTFSGAEAS